MKMEKEITVLVTCSYEELHKQLVNNNFQIIEEYEINDYYMIDKNINIKNLDKLEILKKCILVREIVDNKKVLLYKYKKYANNGDIIEQGKIECPIFDVEKAICFMEAINYVKIFNIYDKCIVYANGKTELVVQLVNDKYIYIEMEDKSSHINRKYNSIIEMKSDLDSYNLPYKKDNYFVKKAEIELNEILKGSDKK